MVLELRIIWLFGGTRCGCQLWPLSIITLPLRVMSTSACIVYKAIDPVCPNGNSDQISFVSERWYIRSRQRKNNI